LHAQGRGRGGRQRRKSVYGPARMRLIRMQVVVGEKRMPFGEAYRQYVKLAAACRRLESRTAESEEDLAYLKKRLDGSRRRQEDYEKRHEANVKQHEKRVENATSPIEVRIKRADEERRAAEALLARSHGPVAEECAKAVVRRRTDEINRLRAELGDRKEKPALGKRSWKDMRGGMQKEHEVALKEQEGETAELEGAIKKQQSALNKAKAQVREHEAQMEAYNVCFEQIRDKMLAAGILRSDCDYELDKDQLRISGGIWKMIDDKSGFEKACEAESQTLFLMVKNLRLNGQEVKAKNVCGEIIRLFSGSAIEGKARGILDDIAAGVKPVK